MGVLDPVVRNAEEIDELNDKYSDWIDLTAENLEKYAGAIINDHHDLMEEEDPFFFLIWRNDDLMSINSMEEIERELKTLKMFKGDLSVGALKSRYMEAFAEKRDVEPDYDNPVESYAELEKLEEKVENLSENIENTLIEKYDLNPERFTSEYNRAEYVLIEALYSLSESIQAFPMEEAQHEAKENIAHEKENLLSKAVDEHRKHTESVDQEYDRVEMPDEPVDWDDVIEEENLQDYMVISDLPGVTYGDTLHNMMEKLAEDIEGVEPEYPLHFMNKGSRDDKNKARRIDNTLRPDAVGDLFVYEFKHMPKDQRDFLDQNGHLERNEKFRENVEQVNTYLNELDMPVGMLVQISSDMEVKEYVIEKHDQSAEDYENFIHQREDYEFDNIASQF
jgi:hypothetical protein